MTARAHVDDTMQIQAMADSERDTRAAVEQKTEAIKERLRAIKRRLSPAGGMPAVQRARPGPQSPVPPPPGDVAVQEQEPDEPAPDTDPAPAPPAYDKKA